MPMVVAFHTIHRNPSGQLATTGEVDDDGVFITQAVVTIHKEGDVFAIDDRREYAQLMADGAIADAPDDASSVL